MDPQQTTPSAQPTTQVAPTPPPQQPPSMPAGTTSLVYAGFGTRLVAFIIDAIVLGIIGGGFTMTINSGGDATSASSGMSTLVGALYFILLWNYWDGQTLGKKAMGIKVVKEDGSKLDLGTAVVRYIGYFISAIPILLGFIWVAFDSKKQGFHDKIAKTIVVKV